ncbi:MAG: hypothetical protein GWN99_17395 [Gemmatimonadetes bacterium]|uniref:DUF1569 domain-containing protein n=1 Tax=Candidatus Kutchimonas denitrificans TaxID=3056748 RepID=A0AAE4Z7X1_9BACT|nr:hypothetical protein [Gemmatimonadota bacterium]NIR74623.1 hypothetical protein [Candidatus Kutchimonas denitrificans]NIS02813.1 hypothetical protein [Gemmatimonadota bacterium]NIT68974.1 hypothetical protein [Gemmatimonadota bacterium]NIU52279.1 hypothetical protein [Gemmatimonadota bacterium]
MTAKTVDQPEALAQLIARLEALEPDTRRRWGTLTPGAMLCHLADAASSALEQGSDPGRRRPLLRWIGLYAPFPWPRGFKAPQRFDPQVDGTRPGDFEEDRAWAIGTLRAIASAPDDAFRPSHYVFGAMRPRDWRRWAYRHTHHHLRQFGL